MANKKKGTGVKGKTSAKTTTKSPKKEAAADNNKVVKFEKPQKTSVDFEGVITKIKIPVKKEIPIIMYKKSNDRGTKEVTFKDGGRPLDSFIAALQNLCPYFLNVVEITNKSDETTITGVHFSKGGIIISGSIELTEIEASIPVNTPLLKLENENGYEVPQYAKDLIEELKRQAIFYMNGDEKEKQMDIPGIKKG